MPVAVSHIGSDIKENACGGNIIEVLAEVFEMELSAVPPWLDGIFAEEESAENCQHKGETGDIYKVDDD